MDQLGQWTLFLEKTSRDFIRLKRKYFIRLSFLCILFVLAFCSVTYGISSDFVDQMVVEADDIVYEEGLPVRATGNVVFRYKDVVVRADHFVFDSGEWVARLSGNIIIERNRMTFWADSMYCDFHNFEGVAINARSNLEGYQIAGGTLRFSPDNIQLKDAEFTTCDLDHPHYRITAQDLQIFPTLGLSYTFSDTLYFRMGRLGETPILWIPSYVYGTKSYSVLGSSSPLPEIKISDVEGVAIKWNLANYVVGDDSFGRTEIGYSTKLGALAGIRHGLILNDVHVFTTNLQYRVKSAFHGNLQYQIDFADTDQPVTKNNDTVSGLLDTYLPVPPAQLGKFTARLSFRDLVRDYWVTHLPFYELEGRKIGLPYGYHLAPSVSFGFIKEENADLEFIQRLSQTNLNLRVGRTFQLADDFPLKNTNEFLGFWYGDGSNWIRGLSRFKLTWTKYRIQPFISFNKRVHSRGVSAFDFEAQDAVESDEIGAGMSAYLFGHAFRYEEYYDLEKNEPRRIDMKLDLNFHCWKLTLNWERINNEFSFSTQVYPPPDKAKY